MVHPVAVIAVFCKIVLSVVADSDSLYFNPQPEDISAIEGISATLKCGVTHKANITFYWTVDGETVKNDTRRSMVSSNLVISRVSKIHDIGEFKCIATDIVSGQSITSRGAQINILWITDSVRVIQEKDEKEISIGDKLTLHCKAEGNPQPEIIWYYNRARILKDKSDRITFKSNQLHIRGLIPKDNGIYSCRAKNDLGFVDSNENFVLKLSDGTSPHIIEVPNDVIVPENSTAYFTCSYKNAASVDWIFQNEHLENNSRYIIYPNGNLQISLVKFEDAGIYECKAQSLSPESSPNQVYAAELQVAYINNMTMESLKPQPRKKKIFMAVHSPFDITCHSPKGLPKPKMWWTNPEGRVIDDSSRIYVEDMRLVFSEVRETDSGEYTCAAENIAGKTNVSALLYVSEAPALTKHPEDTVANEGNSANFQCTYSSKHPASLLWLKNEIYLKDTGNHVVFNENNSSLTIRNVAPNDVGSYQCEVESEGLPPLRSKPAYLSVKEKLKFMPAPVNRKLELGSNTKIYCKAGGSTAPFVKWTKMESDSAEWPPHIKDENGTLYFSQVLNSDAGKYRCVATNSQGTINATIDVDVIVMPKFSVQPSDTVVNEGEPVALHCLAEGDPSPIIQWDKNNELNGFNHERFKVLENGSLFASEVHVDDEGKYGCTAGNSGGLRRHEVSLTIKSKELNKNLVGRSGNEGENTMTKTVTITLGAAGIYIVLVVSLMMWCRYQRAKRKALMLAQATADGENSDVPDLELKERTTQKTNNDVHLSEETTKFLQNDTNKLLLPRKKLSTVMLLGHGEFGEVFLAKTEGMFEENTGAMAMVKALEAKNENITAEFNREMSMYVKMKHENISTVLGLHQETKPYYMVLDYTDWGDLKQFLLATRPDAPAKVPKQAPLSVPQNLMICQQVAVGMEYLSKQFTHKDLAARNCLISSSFKIKISCPCLSLDTYSEEYYNYNSKIIPLRWSPLEAVVENNYSKSDIWSFGVLIWEVFNRAELPYAEMSNEEVLNKLQTGELTFSIPNGAPESLVKLLERCRSQDISSRPNFSEAVATFVELSVAVEV